MNMEHFGYSHLPVDLGMISKAFHDLAHSMMNTLPHCAEREAGLRKLLEAKDCAVRARLEDPSRNHNLNFDAAQGRPSYDDLRMKQGMMAGAGLAGGSSSPPSAGTPADDSRDMRVQDHLEAQREQKQTAMDVLQQGYVRIPDPKE